MRTVIDDLIDLIWGGFSRPDDDAGQLRAIADWMDKLDDMGDKLSADASTGEKVSRTMQKDLRRIAKRLDN